jgi:hypothetical protein
MTAFAPEIGRTLRWRGMRWRVLALEDSFARLVGIDHANDGEQVSPLLALRSSRLYAGHTRRSPA